MANSKAEWLLSQRPRSFKVANPEAVYAVVMVVGGDSDLAKQMGPDIAEMVVGFDETISVLLLIDFPGDSGAVVAETTPTGLRVLDRLNELSTGDPRVLSAFWARALVSYSSKTRFALGFWGHGKGVYGDYDAGEILLPAAIIRQALPRRPRRQRRPGISAMGMLPDKTSRDILTNREARSALSVAFARADRKEPVDIIFSDTCLNGSVEVYTELREFAQTVVASSLVVSAEGWNYTHWLKITGSTMPPDAREWAHCALAAYQAAYPQREGCRVAQLAAFSTDADLVKAFAKVVKALAEMEKERARELLSAAALEALPIHYRENLDLKHLVLHLLARAEKDSPLSKACSSFFEVFFEALIGISAPPQGDFKLGGLTIWCPQVERRYRSVSPAILKGWSGTTASSSSARRPNGSSC